MFGEAGLVAAFEDVAGNEVADSDTELLDAFPVSAHCTPPLW
jgi:hypothetical protein